MSASVNHAAVLSLRHSTAAFMHEPPSRAGYARRAATRRYISGIWLRSCSLLPLQSRS